jgi:hypothetical protein
MVRPLKVYTLRFTRKDMVRPLKVCTLRFTRKDMVRPLKVCTFLILKVIHTNYTHRNEDDEQFNWIITTSQNIK